MSRVKIAQGRKGKCVGSDLNQSDSGGGSGDGIVKWNAGSLVVRDGCHERRLLRRGRGGGKEKGKQRDIQLFLFQIPTSKALQGVTWKMRVNPPYIYTVDFSGERRRIRRAEQEPIMHGHHLPRNVHRLHVWNGEFSNMQIGLWTIR